MYRIPQLYTGELVTQAPDLVGSSFKGKYRDQDFRLVHLGDRIEIYFPTESTPAGHIQLISPRAGNIWSRQVCIGEYSIDENSTYIVEAYSSGSKTSRSWVTIDPLRYLLRYLIRGN